jgi:hypothetical protein
VGPRFALLEVGFSDVLMIGETYGGTLSLPSTVQLRGLRAKTMSPPTSRQGREEQSEGLLDDDQAGYTHLRSTSTGPRALRTTALPWGLVVILAIALISSWDSRGRLSGTQYYGGDHDTDFGVPIVPLLFCLSQCMLQGARLPNSPLDLSGSALSSVTVVKKQFSAGIKLFPNATLIRIPERVATEYVGIPTDEIDQAWKGLILGECDQMKPCPNR